MSTPPWDIYAEQLFSLGYGYPLWIPEPNQHEVDIGDVGWIQDGEFCTLFNSRKPEDSPVNIDKGVPLHFDMFSPPISHIYACQEIMPKMVCSRGIRAMDAETKVGAATTDPPVSGGAGIDFISTTSAGALVLLDSPGQSEVLRSKLRIVNYMYDNHRSWLEFANASASFGLDLDEEDIIFVCGTIKTTKWTVAAFQGVNFRQKEGLVTGPFGPYASVDLSISISDQILPTEHYRHGPQRRPRSVPLDHLSKCPESTEPDLPHPPDQCLFVHYYKMKRRSSSWLFDSELEWAAGGPLALDTPWPVDAAREFESEQRVDIVQESDPLNILLDYILSQSVETKVAIASDLDLYAIFANREFPRASEMLAALEEVRSAIEVDERGVGTISVDYRIDYPANESDSLSSDELWQRVDLVNSVHASDRNNEADTRRKPHDAAHKGRVTALTYAADGSFVASGSEDTNVLIWDVRARVGQWRLEGHEDAVCALAISQDNAVLASASQGEHIILWDVKRGEKLLEVVPYAAVDSLAYTPDGTKLIAGASDGSLHVWSHATYELEKTIEQNTTAVTFIVFSQDGGRMATGGTESVCYIWETVQLELAAKNPQPLSVLTVEENHATICAAAFSPDGLRVVTATDDGSSRVWEAGTGEALLIMHEHTGPVWSVAFCPDGKRVASGSGDSTVKVCDSYTGERLLSLEGHKGIIHAVQFSPDGRWIASAASDHTVRLWGASDGLCARIYNEHKDSVTSVVFLPKQQLLASGSYDGTIQMRRLPLPGQSHVVA
ncbi:WD40 repeat-like protein [Lentinus brumalis]|uniref:WD40 repeat-like protein n=1 Tax=Lentinus brumalis TaxID=2498619 RepID=A0A371D0J0_9APHY|nr:WD40 repeat-like protein [Polyporus brumalis]